MSNPSQPKGPPGAPMESPTKAFVLKIDGWMADLMGADIESIPEAPPADPAAAPDEQDPSKKQG